MIILKLAKNKNELRQSRKKFSVKKVGRIFIRKGKGKKR
jgi:hypothetical protein